METSQPFICLFRQLNIQQEPQCANLHVDLNHYKPVFKQLSIKQTNVSLSKCLEGESTVVSIQWISKENCVFLPAVNLIIHQVTEAEPSLQFFYHFIIGLSARIFHRYKLIHRTVFDSKFQFLDSHTLSTGYISGLRLFFTINQVYSTRSE